MILAGPPNREKRARALRTGDLRDVAPLASAARAGLAAAGVRDRDIRLLYTPTPRKPLQTRYVAWPNESAVRFASSGLTASSAGCQRDDRRTQ